MPIRCIIVDDEVPARDELRYLLAEYKDIEVIAEAESASTAISKIEELKPDLVFLDIQMPGGDGFSVIETLVELPSQPLYVFITAFDHYAVKAFEAGSIDYLLKPISVQRLEQTIRRIRQSLELNRPSSMSEDMQSLLIRIAEAHSPLAREIKIPAEKNGRICLLNPEKIIYFQYDQGKIFACLFEARLPVYGIATMEKLDEHLQGFSFFRIHRSALVNIDYIREFSPWFHGKYNLIMNDAQSTELCVSRSRVKDFKLILGL